MWNHCIVCSSDLGDNEDLEEFQVGRRIAFDGLRGRLWVVCPRCERWNLVPIEQRWEAVEALERAYRGTPARYSTAEVGLARLSGGLEIVRIGKPVPGEFAAWRWGSRFGRRKRRLKSSVKRGKLLKLESGTAWAAGIALAPLAPVLAPLALAGGLLAAPILLLNRLDANWHMNQGLLPHHFRKGQLRAGGITPSDIDPGWSIHVQRTERVNVTGGETFAFKWAEFSGEEAIRLARRALPLLNRRTPKFVTISDAVNEISEGGGVERYLIHAAGLKPKWVAFRHYPEPILLAMEMALFESEERRALEGELERLVEAWREAEEIAAISDNLILPKGWEAFKAEVRASGGQTPSTLSDQVHS
ncbi:MAG: hypothetical protein HKO65_05750 [Gemmatimonadetes bacterium]|nr:hypothetical protein [Gemmatimonadota bacterium]NNM04589.1 hypothetical protein [Gemmatimonadota bacterium]